MDLEKLTVDEKRVYVGLLRIEIRRYQCIPQKQYMVDALTLAMDVITKSIEESKP